MVRLFLRELVHVYRFFRTTPKKERLIVFYAEHKGYYPNFEGLVRELTGNHGCTLCYITSDPDDPILKTRERHIRPFYIRTLFSTFMLFVNSRVFVMTLTDLNQLHLKRSTNPVHYVYVFHSLVSTHMMYRDGAFDHYDTIFSVGPQQTKELRRHEELNGLPAKKLVEAGYYRLERVYEAYKDYSSTDPVSAGKGTILIAPSWGPGNVIESYGTQLTETLLKAGYAVIVRPHPETVRRCPEVLKQLSSRFAKDPDFTLELSIATDESLLKSDVLICDCSGIALEYALGTERPVLFIDVPVKVQNDGYKELGIEPLELSLRPEIGVIVSSGEVDTVAEVVAGLMAKADAYKERLAALREENVYAFTHSSEVGGAYIAGLAEGKQPDELLDSRAATV